MPDISMVSSSLAMMASGSTYDQNPTDVVIEHTQHPCQKRCYHIHHDAVARVTFMS